MEKKIPGFMIYREDAVALSLLPDKDASAVIKGAADYFLSGDCPTLTGKSAHVFEHMRESIDRGQEEYKKRVEAGRKGGLARWNSNKYL